MHSFAQFRRVGQWAALSCALLADLWAEPVDFADLSLEQLSNIQISSLGRKRAAVFSTPGAAAIITGEDIARGGATDLATALRLAPGLQIARVNAASYAISARGFNDATSSKLLVLMDGRSIYSQLISGAHWNYQSLLLEDISRIEVLRGPAASLWGANAVNGVVNIVTKSAHETLGSYVSVATGDHLDTDVAVRQGVRLNANSALRVYASHQKNDSYGVPTDAGSGGWQTQLAGARFDWERPSGGGFTLIGEYRNLSLDSHSVLPSFLPPYVTLMDEVRRTTGGNLLARWVEPLGNETELRTQASLDYQKTNSLSYGEKRLTGDIEVQITAHPFPRHDIVGGATYRSSSDDLRSSPYLVFDQLSATTEFYGAFLQDEISLLPERLSVTLGAKIERNTYSGWEPQPSARILWHPAPTHALWAGISKAARTPSRSERGVTLLGAVSPPTPPNPLPVAINAIGSPLFSSEHLVAYELGHRYKPNSRWSFDTALYYQDYEDLRGLRPELGSIVFTGIPHANYNLTAINNMHGETYGGEVVVRYQPSPAWQFEASVASVRTRLRKNQDDGVPDLSMPGLIGNTPHEEYKLRAGWEITPQWSFDTFVRQTGRLAYPNIPSYTGLDARLAWRPHDRFVFEIVGRDLLDPTHGEIPSNFIAQNYQEIARSYFLRVTYRH